MKRIMKWLLLLAAIPITGLLILFLIGLFLPAKHELARAVTLRETGKVRNPFFRAMAWMFGLDKHVTQHLHDLARKFGETGKVETI